MTKCPSPFTLLYNNGIEVNGKEIPIRIPIKWEPLWIMAQRGETKYIKKTTTTRMKGRVFSGFKAKEWIKK